MLECWLSIEPKAMPTVSQGCSTLDSWQMLINSSQMIQRSNDERCFIICLWPWTIRLVLLPGRSPLQPQYWQWQTDIDKKVDKIVGLLLLCFSLTGKRAECLSVSVNGPKVKIQIEILPPMKGGIGVRWDQARVHWDSLNNYSPWSKSCEKKCDKVTVLVS